MRGPGRAAWVVWLLVLLLPGSEGGADSQGLSAAQQERLARGDVVVLNVLPPGAPPDGQGGTAIARVHASPEEVWRVLVDYPRHRGLYPRVMRAEVLEARGGETVVRYVVGIGPFAFGFHVRSYADPLRRRVEWRLDRGRPNDLFQDNRGYWQVDPDPEGALVTYAMAARTVFPPFLTRGAERDSLVDTVKAVRAAVERRA